MSLSPAPSSSSSSSSRPRRRARCPACAPASFAIVWPAMKIGPYAWRTEVSVPYAHKPKYYQRTSSWCWNSTLGATQNLRLCTNMNASSWFRLVLHIT